MSTIVCVPLFLVVFSGNRRSVRDAADAVLHRIRICFPLSEVCPVVLVLSSRPDETSDAPVASGTPRRVTNGTTAQLIAACGTVTGFAGHPRNPRTSSPGRRVREEEMSFL